MGDKVMWKYMLCCLNSVTKKKKTKKQTVLQAITFFIFFYFYKLLLLVMAPHVAHDIIIFSFDIGKITNVIYNFCCIKMKTIQFFPKIQKVS